MDALDLDEVFTEFKGAMDNSPLSGPASLFPEMQEASFFAGVMVGVSATMEAIRRSIENGRPNSGDAYSIITEISSKAAERSQAAGFTNNPE